MSAAQPKLITSLPLVPQLPTSSFRPALCLKQRAARVSGCGPPGAGDRPGLLLGRTPLHPGRRPRLGRRALRTSN